MGEVIERVSRKRHQCKPPGVFRRWRLDLDNGSEWACECGAVWELRDDFGYSRWVKLWDGDEAGGKERAE